MAFFVVGSPHAIGCFPTTVNRLPYNRLPTLLLMTSRGVIYLLCKRLSPHDSLVVACTVNGYTVNGYTVVRQQSNANRLPTTLAISVMPLCMHQRQARTDHRLPTTDYSVDSRSISMYALAEITPYFFIISCISSIMPTFPLSMRRRNSSSWVLISLDISGNSGAMSFSALRTI